MIIAIVASLALVLATVAMHYEGLRLIGRISAHVTRERRKVLTSVLCVFALHLLEISLYAAAYWFFDNIIDIGSFTSVRAQVGFDYFHFSAETFTTLGMGDIYPEGPLRLLASIETINGLLLLGWSTSFTFYEMQRHWTNERG